MAAPTRKKAIEKLQRIEDGLLHVKATLPRYLDEITELREWLEGPKSDPPKGKDSPDAPAE